MKFIQADGEKFQFEMSREVRLRFLHILGLYPLVPEHHHRLSKRKNIPNCEENQQMLEEALLARRRENHKQVEALLKLPLKFTERGNAYRIEFTRAEMESLLQILNDIRVGSWIAMGSPGEREAGNNHLDKKNALLVMAMDLAGAFESYFLEAISGELQPEDDPPMLGTTSEFPRPELSRPDGLVAVGGDLSVNRLLSAYRQGIFPWSVDPVTWWSPDPRGIIELDEFHVSESLARTIRKCLFDVTFDRAFEKVMQACSTPGPKRRGTWITSEFIEAYGELHRQGHAHSVECWKNGELVGGVYGVAIGGLFAGESMFHLVNDSSKVALYHLVRHLQERQFTLFDIQMVTDATEPLGAKAITRTEYLKRLSAAVSKQCSF